jgi:hypothetical protein
MWTTAWAVVLVHGVGMADWGEPNEAGLVSRLTLVSKEPQLGKKLLLRLEIKNIGTAPAKFDDQQARVNSSLAIRGPRGVAVPYIGTSFQTAGQSERLAPNQAKTIFADMDAAEQYLFEQPGEYTIQFVGRGGIPKSNELKVTLKDGKLTDLHAMVAELRKVVPQGWRVTTYMDSITILNTPTSLKRDATSVTVFFTKTKVPEQRRGVQQPPAKYLMETRLGHAWMQPQDEQMVLRWGEYEQVISHTLKAFRK